MSDQRRWLECQCATSRDEIDEHREILPTLGRSSRTERVVKSSHLLQGGPAEGHVAPRTKACRRIGEEVIGVTKTFDTEVLSAKGTAEPTVKLLEPQLG